MVTLDSRLLEAYRRTRYCVFADACWVLRAGEAPAGWDEWLRARGWDRWAIVTADNPASELCSAECNRLARAALRGVVNRAGFIWLPAANCPDERDWPVERAIFIAQIDSEAARELGARFGQHAVLAGSHGASAQILNCTAG